MVAIHTSETTTDHITADAEPTTPISSEHETALSKPKPHHPTASTLLLPSRIVTHSPKSGLNPLADAASYLFSIVGKLKHTHTYRHLNKLQGELVQEINLFQEAIKQHGYNAEYVVVCRYVICATLDDIISHTAWGSQGQWDAYSLLATFSQDLHHHEKFFSIMDRAIKDPVHYIDLMELQYLCLSLGYKGHYRSTEHNQYQLEQITNNLYKHIRAFRGSFSKTLSPTPLKPAKIAARRVSYPKSSWLFIFFVTACVVMTIFISLGYLMDVISNEAYKNIAQIQQSVTQEHPES